MNELIGHIWPGWEIDELIGRGAYGQVYRIRRSDVGEVTYGALKVMQIPSDEREIQSLFELGMNEAEMYTYLRGTVQSIVSEITLMERLKGAPNVVAIEDYYLLEHKDRPGWTIFIRMELLESLSHYIKRTGMPDPAGAVRMAVDILKALECCEQQRIIHRDIKPDNIFISRFGEFKLGDFGIARQMEAGTKASYTQKGTLSYMAPEVMRGEQYDNTVDLYSLGIVLYRYLNRNRFPFLPLPPAQITQLDMEESQMRRISGESLPDPVEADRSLSEIIRTACDPEPRERYQSASEFREALEGWLRGERQTGGNSAFVRILAVILVLTAAAAAGILFLRHTMEPGTQTGLSADSTETPGEAPSVSEAEEPRGGAVFEEGTDYTVLDYSYADGSRLLLAAVVRNMSGKSLSFDLHFQPNTSAEDLGTVSMQPVEVACEALGDGETAFLYQEMPGTSGDEYKWKIGLVDVEETDAEMTVRAEMELNEPVPEEPLVNDTLSYLIRNTGDAAFSLRDIRLFLYLKNTDGTIRDVVEKQPGAVHLDPGEDEVAVFKDSSIEGSYDPEVFWSVS